MNKEEKEKGKEEEKEENIFDSVCVYGCKSEERSLSCVRQITLILVAVLRHGVVKVNNIIISYLNKHLILLITI